MTPDSGAKGDVRARVLVVDDEATIRKGLEAVLTGAGHEVECVASAEDAVESALEAPPDLAIVDLQLPGQSGMELITAFQERGIETTVVVLTGNASIDTALTATRQGVYDYLVKPVDRQRLVEVVRKGLERTALRREVLELRHEMVRAGRFQHLIGSSPQMLQLYRLIEQVAPSDAAVLILGESGTGKELVARTIHQLSGRASARLVAINCAAIPASLLESEIFGHERGSFTGATAARAGCFERADQGTLLLDEIAEMPFELQSKLLRVLEDGKVRRVGGTREKQFDVRVISATNRTVDAMLDDQRLREDLYYRLNVFTIRIPPLRERRRDIPLLAEHFLSTFAAAAEKAIAGYSAEASDLLRAYDWPGNARELRNAVERAVILCPGGDIQARHLPEGLGAARRLPPDTDGEPDTIRIRLGTSIREAERALILATMEAWGGNKTRTADVLGVSTKTLYSKLRLYEEAGGSPEDA
ncbi:sigma-54 dependent transcriptional regulator [bacterium]|nr:sigma-54 dependent transcriptional regulator [bacterium]